MNKPLTTPNDVEIPITGITDMTGITGITNQPGLSHSFRPSLWCPSWLWTPPAWTCNGDIMWNSHRDLTENLRRRPWEYINRYIYIYHRFHTHNIRSIYIHIYIIIIYIYIYNHHLYIYNHHITAHSIVYTYIRNPEMDRSQDPRIPDPLFSNLCRPRDVMSGLNHLPIGSSSPVISTLYMFIYHYIYIYVYNYICYNAYFIYLSYTYCIITYVVCTRATIIYYILPFYHISYIILYP
jgi:hypothetical protein